VRAAFPVSAPEVHVNKQEPGYKQKHVDKLELGYKLQKKKKKKEKANIAAAHNALLLPRNGWKWSDEINGSDWYSTGYLP
jgi:hypothetical protein